MCHCSAVHQTHVALLLASARYASLHVDQQVLSPLIWRLLHGTCTSPSTPQSRQSISWGDESHVGDESRPAVLEQAVAVESPPARKLLTQLSHESMKATHVVKTGSTVQATTQVNQAHHRCHRPVKLRSMVDRVLETGAGQGMHGDRCARRPRLHEAHDRREQPNCWEFLQGERRDQHLHHV